MNGNGSIEINSGIFAWVPREDSICQMFMFDVRCDVCLLTVVYFRTAYFVLQRIARLRKKRIAVNVVVGIATITSSRGVCVCNDWKTVQTE